MMGRPTVSTIHQFQYLGRIVDGSDNNDRQLSRVRAKWVRIGGILPSTHGTNPGATRLILSKSCCAICALPAGNINQPRSLLDHEWQDTFVDVTQTNSSSSASISLNVASSEREAIQLNQTRMIIHHVYYPCHLLIIITRFIQSGWHLTFR